MCVLVNLATETRKKIRQKYLTFVSRRVEMLSCRREST